MKAAKETKKKIIGYWNKSVILTYLGITFSVIGTIILLLNNNLKLSLTCLTLAGICDMFDGTVARLCKRTEQEKQFGVQIDSLADVVCSLVFPVIIYIHSAEINTSVRHTINYSIVTYIIASMYIICGVSRLAWFNIHTANPNEKVNYYSGMPVTYIAMVLPITHIIGFQFNLCNLTYHITMLITAILFIANFKLKKPGLKAYILFSILTIICNILIWLVI